MSAFLEPNNHPAPPNDRAWHAMVILVIIHIFTSKCDVKQGKCLSTEIIWRYAGT